MSVKIKKARPLFRRALRLSPAYPIDDRVLVRENKPESETETDLAIPDEAKQHPMDGVLVAVGDAAADYCHDRGIETGDTILYARYAGVKQTWKHIVGKDSPKCAHDGAWDIVVRPSGTLNALRKTKDKGAIARAEKWEVAGGPNDNIELRECRGCGTLIAIETVIIMSCKDILASVELQERLESGVMTRYRGQDADGKTVHYIKRHGVRPSCFGSVEPQQLKEVA